MKIPLIYLMELNREGRGGETAVSGYDDYGGLRLKKKNSVIICEFNIASFE